MSEEEIRCSLRTKSGRSYNCMITKRIVKDFGQGLKIDNITIFQPEENSDLGFGDQYIIIAADSVESIKYIGEDK